VTATGLSDGSAIGVRDAGSAASGSSSSVASSHLAGDDAVALTVLVDEREADHVAGVFSRFYQPAALKASERLAS
jgi:hypothetical protein